MFQNKEPEEEEKKTEEYKEQILLVNIGNKMVGRQKNNQEVSFEDQMPKEYWKYYDTIFDKKTFDKLLP